MLFNPHVVDPSELTPNAYMRLYPKSSSIVPGKLFGMDSLLAMTNVPGGYFSTLPTFSLNTFAHYPSHGFDVLFTDGSVQFVQSIPAFNYLPHLHQENYTHSQLFNYLENP